MTDTASESERVGECATALAALIRDTCYLLSAIATRDLGKASTAVFLPEDIKTLEFSVEAYRATGILSADARSNFDIALNRTLGAIAPVTIQTLRDTDTEIVRTAGIWSLHRFPTFEARWLSRTMVIGTSFLILLAVTGDVYVRFYGPPLDQTEGVLNLIGIILQVFTPFTYGAIGASVYLLKSLHTYIYERNYDRRRNTEYGTRILLGMVSGGTVVLLVDQISGDGGSAIKLSSAALGFLTGYNTDFLFSAIERITAAILPKINIDSVRRQDAQVSRLVSPVPPTYDELIKLFKNAATDAERQLITATIQELYKGRPTTS